jgi:spore germination protein GerM
MQRKHLILVLGIVLAGLLGFIAASCGAGDGAEAVGPVPSDTTPPARTVGPQVSSETTETETETSDEPTDFDEEDEHSSNFVSYQVWFATSDGLFVAHRTREQTPRVGTAALEDLLAGPNAAERRAGVTTAIPEGTRLLGLVISEATAFVDLTSEFESGGGSLSMTMRLAQVACTLNQFPTVEGIAFKLDGELVDVFSGEGIVLDHAVACRDYEELLPAIVVDQPRIGQRVANPVSVSGTANVFEANVTVVVLDSRGHEVGRTFATATCGTGCRGRFRVAVSYEVAAEQKGTILVQDDDAAGTGTPPHQVRIPVILTPSP